MSKSIEILPTMYDLGMQFQVVIERDKFEDGMVCIIDNIIRSYLAQYFAAHHTILNKL